MRKTPGITERRSCTLPFGTPKARPGAPEARFRVMFYREPARGPRRDSTPGTPRLARPSLGLRVWEAFDARASRGMGKGFPHLLSFFSFFLQQPFK